MTREPRIVLGGVLDPAAGDFYIERRQDQELAALLRAGGDCLIVGPRQTGKSSIANNVAQRFAAASEFRRAWFDFDIDATAGIDPDGIRRAMIRAIGQQIGSPIEEDCSLIEAFERFTLNGPPLLLILDELDAIRRFGRHGATLIPELRALQAARKTHAGLRMRFVLIFISCRGLRSMYNLDERGGPTAPFELAAEVMRLGRFDASDGTRTQLARAFMAHDPLGADNLALMVLEESGGFPQLTMALTKRVLETGVRKGLDRDTFIRKEVAWWKAARSEHTYFLDTPAAFFEDSDIDPRVAREAILLYGELLRGAAITWDAKAESHLLLEASGLAVIEDGSLRTLGRFLNEYYNEMWVVEIRRKIERRLTTRLPIGNKPRVAILVTGGTIGMVERNGQVRPPSSSEELQDEYRQIDALFDTEWTALADLDSANIGPRHWGDFSRSIYQRLLADDCDGIVVAHGTDTLAFTASAVAFALGRNLDRPVVFTGSQTTVDVAHGDARSNILRACMVAGERSLPEVVIAFNDLIFRAVTATKRDDRRFDAFESPFYPPLGTIAETVELQPELIRRSAEFQEPIDFQPGFVDGILVVLQVPGLRSSFYEAAIDRNATEVRGVVIQTLGAGNVPDRQEYDLTPFIEKAISSGIPVLMSSQYPVHAANLGRYLTSESALAAGAIPMANMTTSALVAKFSWALARLEADALRNDTLLGKLRQYMWADLVGELDPRGYETLRSLRARRQW